MQMHTDDEIYAVDDYFLGPSKQTLPWRVRYRAYGIGAILYSVVLLLEIWTGLISFWNAVYGLVATIWATMQIMERVDHEHTVRAVVVTFWHELSAPRGRRDTRPTRSRISLSSVRRRRRTTA